MSDAAVPRPAERLLEALGTAAELREAVLGDLAEEFAERADRVGPAAARRWYYREGVRVAPHLVGGWWRGLRRDDVGALAGVVVLASLAMFALERLLQLAARGLARALDLPHGTPGFIDGASVGVAALMLAWTLLDGAFAGYVAARLGRRAPLPGVLVLALVWCGVVLLSRQGHAVPTWFRAANAATLTAAVVAGGALRVVRARPERAA